MSSEMKNLIDAICEVSTYDFSDYSEKSFKRRVEKVIEDHRINIGDLIVKIKNSESFLEEIVKEITVNTTEIFRDTKTWQTLKNDILRKYKDKESIDIWHVGCSTGQEVYSILILLNEIGMMDKARIIATDLNTDVIDVAKKGVYKFREIDEFIESYDSVMMTNPNGNPNHIDVPYQKYIIINRRKNIIKIKPLLLNKVEYYKHDIILDGNIFGRKFDFIFCRNVLIYFNHQLQNKLFEFFYENINDDGALIIGRHEGMLGQISGKFKKIESIYLKNIS
ncbi:MAG: protein-glutamate O-methyltransferase CheR [Bacteroidetes bacterium]|nr:MAG: protein-glutamate O-methyltransferase CheR [Bacteroidota bacterium]